MANFNHYLDKLLRLSASQLLSLLNMPDFSYLLEAFYNNWHQNESIPSSVSPCLVTLKRKDENKRYTLDKFRPITLLNTKFKFLPRF